MVQSNLGLKTDGLDYVEHCTGPTTIASVFKLRMVKTLFKCAAGRGDRLSTVCVWIRWKLTSISKYQFR